MYNPQRIPAGKYRWYEAHARHVFKKTITREGTTFQISEYEFLLFTTTNEWDFIEAADCIVKAYRTDDGEESLSIAA